ncbi:MAG: M23 family metallopeptidase [Elusimicrobia bacterium]|nr:M23 family metallopeptidase [Elusimicrobiota bacterium]
MGKAKTQPVKLRWRLLVLLAAFLAVGAAWLHRDLAAKAEIVDEPYGQPSRSFGRGGDKSITRALMQLGSAHEEAYSVGQAVLRKLGKDWKGPFVVVAGPEGFHHVTAFRGKRRAIVGRGSAGVLLAPVEERLVHAKGEVRGGVPVSLVGAGMPPDTMHEFVDLFRWSIDLVADAQDGDTFQAIWTERVALNKPIGWRLEGAVYESALTGRISAMRWDAGFFDRRGRSVKRTYLKAPVRYRWISSGFGKFRSSPLGWPMRRHKGTDFAAEMGTPIVAVADGRVSFAGWKGEYGHLVVVTHEGQRETFYGHLGRFGPGVRRGVPVVQGQVLGYVGVTGNATGPHLHFELRKSGATEDFRAARLPSRPAALATRPIKFKARWKELFGS